MSENDKNLLEILKTKLDEIDKEIKGKPLTEAKLDERLQVLKMMVSITEKAKEKTNV